MDKADMAKNRRGFFRIYDEANLFYQKIDQALLAGPTSDLANDLQASPLFSDIEKNSESQEMLLPRLDKDRSGFQYTENGTRNVNISASGIAFNCEDALNAGDYLIIKILLLSSMTVILTYCKIVYCKDNQFNNSRQPYFVGAHFVGMDDEDREALIRHVARRRTQQHWVRGFILAAAITVIVAPDVIFDLLSSLLHFLFVNFLHFLHIAFEFIESSLDHLVEHLFHTNTRQTQIIVFYILVVFAIGGFYWLWRAVPPFCRKCKNNLLEAYARKKASLLFYWDQQSLFNKVKLAVISAAAIICYFFFGM